MFTALTSLLTNRTVWKDAAMTGEISLRGLVLPVGGIEEKVVAAAAASLMRVKLRRATRGTSTTFRRAPATRWSSSGSNAAIRSSKPHWIRREMSPVQGQLASARSRRSGSVRPVFPL
jgi:hypothetical protein